MSDEAKAQTVESANTSVKSIKAKAGIPKSDEEEADPSKIDPNLTDEQKKQIKDEMEFLDKHNSYIFFRIEDILKIYDDFMETYKESSGDVSEDLSKSYSKKYGKNTYNDGDIVSIEQKRPLYQHMLFTEKYNFNKVIWKWFAHDAKTADGKKLTVANGGLKVDKVRGLQYPDDGKNELDIFVKLTVPYLETWQIPLAMHSAFLTKSGDSKVASKFTYSSIRYAYSNIIAYKHDIETYILKTTFNDYIETKYWSNLNLDVRFEVTYTAKVDLISNPNIEKAEMPSSSFLGCKVAVYTENFDHSGIENFDERIKNVHETHRDAAYADELITDLGRNVKGVASMSGYINGDQILEDYIHSQQYIHGDKDLYGEIGENVDNLIYKRNGVGFNTVLAGKDDGTYYVLSFTPHRIQENYRWFTYYEVYREITKCTVTNNSVHEYKRDSNNNILYDAEYKYNIIGKSVLEPDKTQKYKNTRADDGGYESDIRIKEGTTDQIEVVNAPRINVMNERQVGDPEISTDFLYHIKSSETFDIKTAMEFNYIRYSDEDARHRIRPDSEIDNVSDFIEKVDIANKIVSQEEYNVVDGTTSIDELIKDKTLYGILYDSGLRVTEDYEFRKVKDAIRDTIGNTIVSTNDSIVDTTYGYLLHANPGESVKVENIIERDVANYNTVNLGGRNLTKQAENPYNVPGTGAKDDVYKYTSDYSIKLQKKDPYIEREGLAKNNMGTHVITRTYKDKLTTISAPQELYKIDDLIKFNARHNAQINGTEESEEANNFKDLTKNPNSFYNEYLNLAEEKKLNNIDFINSNNDIYDRYLIDYQPVSKIIGYDRVWIEDALEVLKEMFEDTAEEKGKTPYVYGVTLGLDSKQNASSVATISGSGMGIGFLTNTNMISEDDFVSAIQNYMPGVNKGTDAAPFINNARIIYEICVANGINPILCAGQAWREQGWVYPSTSPYNYWGIGVFTGTNEGNKYEEFEQAIEGYCHQIKRMAGLGTDESTQAGNDLNQIYRNKATEFANAGCTNFTTEFTSFYDPFSAYCSPAGAESMPAIDVANYVVDYVDVMIECMRNIFPNTSISVDTSDVISFAKQYLNKKASEINVNVGYEQTPVNIFSYTSQCGAQDIWFPDEWCAMFVSFCFDNCKKIPTPLPFSFCGCSDGWNRLKELKLTREKGTYTPKAGDIVFFQSGGRICHVGLVSGSNGTTVSTIEGNSKYNGFNNSIVSENNYEISSQWVYGFAEM